SVPQSGHNDPRKGRGAMTNSPDGKTTAETATALQKEWHTDPRWKNVTRDYTAEDVVKLRGTIQEEHTLARHGAERLWDKLHSEDYINALGALTVNQAVPQVKAGLQA